MDTETTFRKATKDDCRAIARLFQLSSGGVADYVWSGLEAPGLSLLEIGAGRYAREDTPFSYQNCVMAERDGAVLGMLHSYPMTADPEPAPEPLDPVLRPYAELEVAGSLYVAGMAFLPEHRNQGLGTRLLSVALERARDRGLGSLSLLVFEQNAGALRLYQRNGYETVDRRPVVAHPLIHYTGDVLLMVRTAD
jgi:ribosomal protein S18 acetylase RimI-like enzyme